MQHHSQFQDGSLQEGQAWRYTIGNFVFHSIAWLPIVKCLVKDILQDLVEDNVYKVILNLQEGFGLMESQQNGKRSLSIDPLHPGDWCIQPRHEW